MLLKCPSCNARYTLDVALGVDAGRRAIRAALDMPAPIARGLAQYLGLFCAAGRDLSFDRVERLLGELQPMLAAETVTRNGLSRACPLGLWQAALDRMVEHRDAGKLNLPLKSHGYLLEIAFGLAEAAGAKAEREREAARRSGASRAQVTDRHERLALVSRVRGDVELGLLTPDAAAELLAAANIDPKVLDQ